MKFADTPRAWYQEYTCNILASLSLVVEANKRLENSDRGSSLYRLYYHEMAYHFDRTILETLRLLQVLMHDVDIANDANVQAICKRGHLAFMDIIDGNMDGFDLEQE